MVCARQQGDVCNSIQVCDATRKLQCTYADPFSATGICRGTKEMIFYVKKDVKSTDHWNTKILIKKKGVCCYCFKHKSMTNEDENVYGWSEKYVSQSFIIYNHGILLFYYQAFI